MPSAANNVSCSTPAPRSPQVFLLFTGCPTAIWPRLSITFDIGGDLSTNPNDVTFVFDEPVQPGETVTVRVKAKRNPRVGGIYLFGVTAFPEGGEDSPGLYLGSGRLHFYK